MLRLPALLLLTGMAVGAVAAPPANLAVVEAEIRRLEAEYQPLQAQLAAETPRQQALLRQIDAVQSLTLAVLAFPERWNEARAAWPGDGLKATLTDYETAPDLRRHSQATRKALDAAERQLKQEPSADKRRQKLPPLLLPLSQALGRLAQAAGERQAGWQGRRQELDGRLVVLRQQAAALKPAAPPSRPALPDSRKTP